jgi:predicted RNase H-like HicB family nuclease
MIAIVHRDNILEKPADLRHAACHTPSEYGFESVRTTSSPRQGEPCTSGFPSNRTPPKTDHDGPRADDEDVLDVASRGHIISTQYSVRSGAFEMRAVVLYRGEDGYWVAEVPSLPGCVSQGKTKAEAICNIREAIDGWIESAKAHHHPIPDEPFDAQVVCV